MSVQERIKQPLDYCDSGHFEAEPSSRIPHPPLKSFSGIRFSARS
jgi:hypothetical protein